ncbi:MAG: response regulator [Chloroflexus sp.]
MSTKILLAEDELDLQLITRMALEDASYTVVIANNGFEALEQLACQTFDLLLIDVMMPQMDGLELCQRLQYHPVWRQIPIVLLTASPRVRDLPQHLPSSVRGWVEKPFNVFALVEKVQSVLAGEC